MDCRTELAPGIQLNFPGMLCVIEKTIGRGSNAIVYEGFYLDAFSNVRHRILVKELFPYDPDGNIIRDASLQLCRTEAAEEQWQLHRASFERGNMIHLELLQQPQAIGGNINTYEANGTLYTVLEYSGGRSLDKEFGMQPDLQHTVKRILYLLDVLELFHRQGYYHLDISPENILLIGSGNLERVNLIDFNSVHTMQELLQGNDIYFSAKDGYTAPEVRSRDIRRIGVGTDLYAVTAVLWTCLTGRPMTVCEMNAKGIHLPENCSVLKGIPPTAVSQLNKILRRGLQPLTQLRYKTCSEMQSDLLELINRLNKKGVTHAALWEAGRKTTERMIRSNPSLAYLRDADHLYPLALKTENEEIKNASEYLLQCAADGRSLMLLGEGGIGKSTVLLRTVLTAPRSYNDFSTAILHIPLAEYRDSERNFLLDRMLMDLRFDADTMERARHALLSVLASPRTAKDGRKAMTLLLLDGWNEVGGDMTLLLEEIARLSALPGVCLAVTGRTDDERLALPRVTMTRLTDETVLQTLSAAGLLQPENAHVRDLLHIPMMLSMYTAAAQGLDRQLSCTTERELLEQYLKSACEKTAETETSRLVGEAAVYLVLPAIALEIFRKNHRLTAAELQLVVRRCYRILHSENMVQAFPQWIGNVSRIIGDDDEDAWYGRIVLQLLWKRMGLLTMEDGCCQLPHQILLEHLSAIGSENESRLHRRKQYAALISVMTAVIFLTIGYLIYRQYFCPVPYSQENALGAMNISLKRYTQAITACNYVSEYLEGDWTREGCQSAIASVSGNVGKTEGRYLERLRGEKDEGASVIPWSGKSFDIERCEELLGVVNGWASSSAVSYPRILECEEQLKQAPGEILYGVSREEFHNAVRVLLTDRENYAWALYAMVCVPHEEKLPENNGVRYSYLYGLGNVPALLDGTESISDRSINISDIQSRKIAAADAEGDLLRLVNRVLGYGKELKS